MITAVKKKVIILAVAALSDCRRIGEPGLLFVSATCLFFAGCATDVHAISSTFKAKRDFIETKALCILNKMEQI